MKGQFTARTTLSLAAWDAGPEFEVEMVVTFTVQPGCAQTSLSPAEPPSVEDISIRLFTTKTKTEMSCPTWIHEWFADDRGFQDWLIDETRDQDEIAREEAAEMRRMDRENC
jgi:hypothetical protein